jgi:competence protein ComEA
LTLQATIGYYPLPSGHSFRPAERFEWLEQRLRLTDNAGVQAAEKRKGQSMKKWLLAILMWFTIYGLAIAAVNINTATKDELTSLKGIGEKRAQDIIDYRTKNGPFKSVDDLEKVPGIGPGTMKQIRSELTTTGKTVIDKPAATGTKSKAGDSTKAAKPETKKAESTKGDAMKAEKKAADTKTAKATDTKKAEPAKGDAMKADKAKEKTAAKPMSDEKAPAKADDKKAEKK